MPTRRGAARGEVGFPMARLAVGVAIGVLVLAGCGGDDDEEASLSADAQWADNVCKAADDVTSSLSGLIDEVKFDTNSSDSALEQAETELADRVDTVKQSASDLTDAVTDLPDGTSDAISSAEDDLSKDAQNFSTSVENLGSALSSAANSSGAQEFATAMAAASATIVTAKDSLKSLTDAI